MNAKQIRTNVDQIFVSPSPSSQRTETHVSLTDVAGQLAQEGMQLLGQGGSVSLLLALSLLFFVLTQFVKEVKKD
jgi:hypothetical protein